MVGAGSTHADAIDSADGLAGYDKPFHRQWHHDAHLPRFATFDHAEF
jgi:hypothetical protein